MIFDLLSGGIQYVLIRLVLIIPIILFSLTFHEYAHGWVANKLGDPTAKNLGRLTLNPIRHLDPIGTIMMLVVGVGYAKPVPVNSRYFKNPKRGMAITALAGPAANLILSVIGAVLKAVFIRFLAPLMPYAFAWAVDAFLYYFAYLNAYLAIFNLMPIPPFDGSRIAYVILPDRIYWGVMKYERIIMIVTMVILFTLARFGLNPFSGFASGFVDGIYSLLMMIFH